MKYFLIIFSLFLFSGAAGQKNIIIGYFQGADDTITHSASALALELGKAGVEDITIKSVGKPAEASILLATNGELKKKGVKLDNFKKLSLNHAESTGIVSSNGQVFLTGIYSIGIRHAVYKYLELLGFRYYFPQEEWHVYPQKVNLFQQLSFFSYPIFNNRNLWYAYGTGSDIVWTRYAYWADANCMGGEMQVNVGHSYDRIISRNKELFLRHPEWISNTERPGVIPDNPKFDFSKQGLINFIKEDIRKEISNCNIEKEQPCKMVSLSPSDGIGICDTKDCQKIGSITDRVFYLINTVAKSIKKEFPQTLIGCLAYSEYIAPPNKPVEDNVFVSLTTAYNNSKYSLDELITLWRKKVKKLGIYDYQALYAWDFDLPGQSMASAYHTIQNQLKKYNRSGLISYEAEINTGWINKGLGYYISSKLLWDPSLKSEIIEERFFNDCFKTSAVAAKELFYSWSRFNDPFITESTISRWTDILMDALKKEKDQRVVKRLEMIGNYLQYLIIYNKYKSDPSEANLSEFMQIGKMHLNDESVAYFPAMVVLGQQLKSLNLSILIQGNRENVLSYSPQETIQWLKQFRAGVKNMKKYLKPEASNKMSLVPGSKSYSQSLHDISEDQNSYIGTTYFVFEKKETQSSYFELQADFSVGGGSKLPVVISVYPFKDYLEPQLKPLLQIKYTDTKKWNRYSLATLKKGLYILKVEDPKKGFQLKLSPEQNYSIYIPENTRLEVGYIHSFYFFVPKGTQSFKFIKSKALMLIDPSGNQYDYRNSKQEEIEITPNPSQTGIWRLMGVSGFFKPEGIYPVFGIIPSRMLYPE